MPLELLASARAACSRERIAEIVGGMQTKGVHAVTRLCAEYPPPLVRIPWPPPVLFVKGELFPFERAIGIVGTRRCTRRAYEHTRSMAFELGMPVVSGLARGIDTAAHLGALDAKQQTAAVLGCGVDIIYPPENEKIYNNISESGALLSELPPGTAPFATNFPVRNRIIAGLVRGLLVIESELSGGTAITASLALGCGRDIFALPGAPYLPGSALSNMLIKNGAVPVRDAGDIRAYYGEDAVGSKNDEGSKTAPLDFVQSRILELLEREDMGAETVAAQSGFAAGDVNIALTMMELAGLIKRLPGGRYGV